MNKKSLSLILLSLIFVSSLMFVSAAVLENSLPEWLNPISNALNMGDTWNVFIISLIFVAILISSFYNILEITSFFDNNIVKLIISVGLGLIFVLTDLVGKFSIIMIQLAAGFGSIVVWVEIILSFAVFLILSLGVFPKLQEWAVKRQAQKEKMKAMKSSGEAAAAVKGLRNIQKEGFS